MNLYTKGSIVTWKCKEWIICYYLYCLSIYIKLNFRFSIKSLRNYQWYSLIVNDNTPVWTIVIINSVITKEVLPIGKGIFPRGKEIFPEYSLYPGTFPGEYFLRHNATTGHCRSKTPCFAHITRALCFGLNNIHKPVRKSIPQSFLGYFWWNCIINKVINIRCCRLCARNTIADHNSFASLVSTTNCVVLLF